MTSNLSKVHLHVKDIFIHVMQIESLKTIAATKQQQQKSLSRINCLPIIKYMHRQMNRLCVSTQK